ncbi:MAG: hypothetical protein KRP56_02630 [Candidatus Methanogranum gryphiswaldense]|nr:MAG: hypothetical protein KRP56_02630 [Candidatus Methanogranum sp. U3.2.1]
MGDSLTAGALTTTGSVVDIYTVETTDWTVTTAIATTNGISNYNVIFSSVSLEIEAADLTITVDELKTYDGTVFQYTLAGTDVSGLVVGDSLTAGALTTTGSVVDIYTVETTDLSTTNG